MPIAALRIFRRSRLLAPLGVNLIGATLIVLTLASCASKPKPVAPDWTSIPSPVLDAFCGRLRQEAMVSEGVPVTIVSTTQPIVSGAALRSLAHVYGRDAEVSSLASLINSSLPALPVDSTGSHACAWAATARLDPQLHHDVMVAELSAPFLNPFTRGESGLFVRYSVGGHDAQWYWIPLAQRNGIWAIGTVMPTDMHE